MSLFGGTTSTDTTTNLNQLCIESITSTIANCTTSSTQNQTLQFTNIKGDIVIDSSDLSQGATFNLECVLSASKNAEISNNLSAIIGQFAEANGSGLPSLNGTSATTQASLANDISNKLSTVSTSNLTTILTQQQSFIVNNVTGNITMNNVTMGQQASIIAKSLLTSSDISSIINTVQNTTTQSSKSVTQNPISNIITSTGNAIGSIFSSLFSSPGFTLIAIVFLIIVGVVGYFYLSKGPLNTLNTFSNTIPSNFTNMPFDPNNFSHMQMGNNNFSQHVPNRY